MGSASQRVPPAEEGLVRSRQPMVVAVSCKAVGKRGGVAGYWFKNNEQASVGKSARSYLQILIRCIVWERNLVRERKLI